MAIILYSSGVTETYESQGYTFSDQEILSIFESFAKIRTSRLYEVPNTWCVWGENLADDNDEFNKLGSDIIQENVFSPLLFIHDTEIDPAWMMTDEVILKGYEDFKIDLLLYFDEIAENVLRETQKLRELEGTANNLLILTTIGPTEDKRVLFEFDPNRQSEEFYEEEYFNKFSNRVTTFLEQSYKDGDTFVVFADSKSVIAVADDNVEILMNRIIKHFENHEKYEICSKLTKILEKWKKYKAKEKRKTRAKRKNDKD